jgi:sugar lactone lactonase YvrE
MKCKIVTLGMIALCLSLTANAQLNGPGGLVFDGSGNLWVTNGGANQVLKLNPTTGAVIKTITTGLNNPCRLQFALGDLYVLNRGSNNVTVYNSAGKLLRTISSGSISLPLALAVDVYGDVYVGDNSANSVIALNTDGSLVETLTKDDSGFTFIAPGVLTLHGEDIYAGFGPNVGENAVISYNVGEFLTNNPQEMTVYNDNVNTGPTGVAFDSKGNVYIAEFTSATVAEYAPGKGTKPLLVISQGISGPEGIAVDKSGNIYVSNPPNNNITVYGPTGGAPIRTLN